MKKQLSLLGRVWRESPFCATQEEIYEVFLKNRGLFSSKEIQAFLSPDLKKLHSPGDMCGMSEAVTRIVRALKNKERIMIFGDFDADGITSTVILVGGLQHLGAEVSYRIPVRHKDSHGLKKHFLKEIAEKNVKLVITCDCGINDKEEAEYARSLGMDIIITDHHEPDDSQFPAAAVAVLNPRRKGCAYPEKNLSGAGIAFKLLSALAGKMIPNSSGFLDRFLEICAIGAIADCVSLRGENRILVKAGLEKLKVTEWEGLRKLFQATKKESENIDEGTVGFLLAPLLNAASRIGDVKTAVQLFLGKNSHNVLIRELTDLNEKRKEMTQKAFDESHEQIRPQSSCQVFFHEEWIPGILGLVAARQTEHLDVPVIAATIREDGLLAASCRAPEGYSLSKALQNFPDLFERFGGHDGAAGFTAYPEKLEEIRSALTSHFASQKTSASETPLEAWISPDVLDIPLLDFLKNLSPFGSGNPQPILGLSKVKIIDVQTMGNGHVHLRIQGKAEGKIISFVAFFADAFLGKIIPGKTFDMLFTVSDNTWNGERRLQLKVKDVRELT